ncbi:MAG TPA: hypothetical protein VGQ99_20160 [Tepidisphaeraceae bacterium]|jgi:hypothetical protein|nr:hypothetical protein [Tepidisphaeraceae bacterium]
MKSIILVLVVSLPGAIAIAQQKPPEKVGLAAALADDEKVISELAKRELTTLRDYMFVRNGISKEQQATYLAVSSVKQLNDSKLTRKQQQDLIHNVSIGIDKVLATMNDPSELMRLNNSLVINGTARHVNVLEYFGENPKVQSQLRPIAEAIDRVYDKAIATAQKKADDVANQMTPQNQTRLAPEWEKAMQLVGLAKFNAANNKHTLAMSIDKADPRRAEVAQQGIAVLTEYEAPEYEIQGPARLGIAKLNIDIGSKESLDIARKKLAEVSAEPKSPWNQKFDAMYFAAVADIVAKDFDAARKGMAAVAKFVSDVPPGDANVRNGAEAAVKMLEYRIFSAEAEAVAGPAGNRANEQAIAVLQQLLEKRPDLTGIINEQMMARLPEQPDVGRLSVLFLKALVGRGNDEVVKAAGETMDRKAIAQAAAAAQEVIKRVNSGREKGLTAEDADRCLLLLGIFHDKLGEDALAASTFLDHVEKYQIDKERQQFAFENALSKVFKLRRDQPDARSTAEIYNRFLQIAVSPPFNRNEFAFEYGRLLLERNLDEMKGNYTEAQRDQMLSSAQKAADLLRKTPDPERKLDARFLEMMAYDQMIDLNEKSALVKDWTAKMNALADEVNAGVAQAVASAPNDAAKNRFRFLKVRTSLLIANLAKDDRSADRPKNLQRALDLLASFEQDVQGLPNAANLIGRVLFIRVNAMLSLGKTDEAMESLGKYLETKTGDEGIQIVYDMLEALNKEFDQAERDKNEVRMAELAAHRAKVSGYMVQRVAKTNNADLKKLLPKYEDFEATALQKAALLEKEPAKKQEYLTSALKIFQNRQKSTPNDRGVQLAIALVQYDMGEYAAAQPVLNELLRDKLLGRPLREEKTADGFRMVPNDAYWDALLKLCWSNVRVAKAGGDKSAKTLEDTQQYLKQLYITYPQPGGAKWGPKFDALRQEILPDWTPPTFTDLPTSQPATRPATQPVAGKV